MEHEIALDMIKRTIGMGAITDKLHDIQDGADKRRKEDRNPGSSVDAPPTPQTEHPRAVCRVRVARWYHLGNPLHGKCTK
eukprot:3938633-Pyramimonas_sp.AAC.1